jgi:exodeoxyribonuclease III
LLDGSSSSTPQKSSEKKIKLSKASKPPQFGKPTYDDFPQGKVNIWSWNINGMNANAEKGTLKKFIQDTDPMILCLNETKTDMDKISRKNFHKHIPDGYQQYWNCSKEKRGYSGVAIFTKVKPIQVLFDIQIPKHDTEGRVLTAEFNKFYLVAVYVPNSGEGLKRLDYRV